MAEPAGERMRPGDGLLEADLAMARAKSEGRDRVAHYTRADHRPLNAEVGWAERIRAALESDTPTLELHAQPVQALRDDTHQWELLVRLPQQDGQLLSPGEFLPIAERLGLIGRLDAWVFTQALEFLERHGGSERRLAFEINVSARSLTEGTFCDLVAERLAGADVDPGDLIFEVNEAAILDYLAEVRLSVERLKDLGCRFALDNFGTKHSSLANLKDLPVDIVKIDGSFIRHLADDETAQGIVRAVTMLGHELGLEVTAMHVGDDDTLALVDGYGVDFVQGFHVGRPVPMDELY